MTDELCEWQKIDEDNGLCMCWFTHDSLDAIKGLDLSDKIIVEFGAGKGDFWLFKRCKHLHVVERNLDWIPEEKPENITYHHIWVDDCSGKDKEYLEILNVIIPDVIINDDAYRFEVIEKALTLKRPLILITDNWMQDFVFYCPKGEELLKDFEHKIFPQQGHTNHEGNCWKTAIHFIK